MPSRWNFWGLNPMLRVEQAKELAHSEAFKGFCEEIDSRVALIFKAMVSCKPDQLIALQAKVQALEEVKRIPGDVIERES